MDNKTRLKYTEDRLGAAVAELERANDSLKQTLELVTTIVSDGSIAPSARLDLLADTAKAKLAQLTQPGRVAADSAADWRKSEIPPLGMTVPIWNYLRQYACDSWSFEHGCPIRRLSDGIKLRMSSASEADVSPATLGSPTCVDIIQECGAKTVCTIPFVDAEKAFDFMNQAATIFFPSPEPVDANASPSLKIKEAHSELKEWLTKVPARPWHCSDRTVFDCRGMGLIESNHPKAEELVAFVAHCCNHLPNLLEAARNFEALIRVHVTGTDFPFDVWNRMHDALAEASGEHGQPALPPALRAVEKINEFETRCNNDQGTDTGEAWELLYQLRDILKGVA